MTTSVDLTAREADMIRTAVKARWWPPADQATAAALSDKLDRLVINPGVIMRTRGVDTDGPPAA